MFCTSLRRRSSFAPVVPTLIAPPLNLRESQLATHDIEIPFEFEVNLKFEKTPASRQLRVLLLSPSSVADAKLNDTFERMQHFASLTGGEDLAIVFLLNPPAATGFFSAKQLADGCNDSLAHVDAIYAYSKLQAELIDHHEMPNIPILPLCKLDGLSTLLKRYRENLTRPPSKPKPGATSFELLQLCTANPPMSQHTAFVLTDLFTNLKDLAETCSSVTSAPNSSSPSARATSLQADVVLDLDIVSSTQGSDRAATKLKRLRELVGYQECSDIIDFWKEEWTIN